MKPRDLLLLGLTSFLLFGACATTDEPVNQKERARMEREMDKMSRKNAQEQNRALRDPTRDPTRDMGTRRIR